MYKCKNLFCLYQIKFDRCLYNTCFMNTLQHCAIYCDGKNHGVSQQLVPIGKQNRIRISRTSIGLRGAF